MKSTNIRYIPELDQLRGVAALLVLVFHAIASTEVVNRYLGTDARGVPIAENAAELIAANGFTGVALFFVISGFIFTWGALQADKFDLKGFFINRVLRIYPLYILLMMTALFLNYGQVTILHVVQYLAGFGNLSAAMTQFDVVLWTISVELQFYLIFPFLLLLLKKQGVKYLFGLIAVMAMLRLVARGTGMDLHNPVYWTLFGRLDQFLIGMILAWWVHKQGWLSGAVSSVRHRVPTLNLVAGLICTSSIFLALTRFYHEKGWKSGNSSLLIAWPSIEAGMWAVIGIFYVAIARRVPARVLRPLQYVGMISFSLYLLHYPILKAIYRSGLVINLPDHAFLSGLATTGLVLLPLSVAAATLTFYIIEKPPLALRRQYARPASREQRLETIYGLHMESDRPTTPP